jgi:hypothetical protein
MISSLLTRSLRMLGPLFVTSSCQTFRIAPRCLQMSARITFGCLTVLVSFSPKSPRRLSTHYVQLVGLETLAASKH